jgi:hypothetical protein
VKHLTFNAISGEGEFGEDDVREEITLPHTIINPEERIRSFGPRKGNRQGTRIVFMSGAGLPVKESPDEVMAALQSLSN